ncbi:GOLPH3/VPS74 family protein [Actinoallomurus rhizosphaericola]|uniref:GOLPH3/VPS74 family protein n=1 Tax=Actinoallomurus rhizosphaericola TaxID=2952536 RepID=UPI002092BC77|nr:GPP34 family phosphoprotein [Actinoallomurus rhizosphaericola]MCO5996063.1 GPP34 family phosphoprotein [Actinoallomurus rhizosphaericola]
MNLPRSLPARLYLLAYDPDKERVTARSRLGLVLRAAALADLYLDQRLADDDGKAKVTAARPTGDPVLDAVLRRIADARPRSWRRWVRADERRIVREVRDQLEKERWIKVERRRILPDRVRLRERRPVKRYAAEVKAALWPAAQADGRTTAALVLAARGELSTVLSRRERREHRGRIEELADPLWPIARALEYDVRQKRAAVASGT